MILELIGAGFGRTERPQQNWPWRCWVGGRATTFTRSATTPEQLYRGIPQPAASRWIGTMFLRGYVSQVDWPGPRYWRQLVSHFPAPKCFSPTGNPMNGTTACARPSFPQRRSAGRPTPTPLRGRWLKWHNQTVYKQVFNARMDDRDYAIGIYPDHLRQVQSAVAANRLLTYDVKEGWEPLCAFLNVPVPAEAFPHKNTKDEFLKRKSFLGAKA